MERYDMHPLLAVALVVLAVVLLVVILPVLMMPLMMGGMMMGGWHHGYPWYGDGTGDGGGMWWGWPAMLLMLVFWLLLIGGAGALVVWVVRRLATSPHGSQLSSAGADSALEVLRQRYAKGEIDRDEYERIRQDLSG